MLRHFLNTENAVGLTLKRALTGVHGMHEAIKQVGNLRNGHDFFVDLYLY